MTTLAYFVLIERFDGMKLGFTSFNQDLTIGNVNYKARSAIDPTAVSSKTNLSADNLEITALLNNEDIKPQELIAGLYDEARVTIALLDFISPPTTIEGGTVLLKGRVGQVKITDTDFTLELRSLSELTNRPLNNRVSPVCPYTFGGSKCGKDLVFASLFLAPVTVTAVEGLTIAINAPNLSANFIGGVLTFTSGLNNSILYEITDVLSSSELVIAGELAGAIEIGDTLTLKANCAKTPTACKAYGNYINFGGTPVGGNFVPGLDRITVIN